MTRDWEWGMMARAQFSGRPLGRLRLVERDGTVVREQQFLTGSAVNQSSFLD